MQLSKFNVSMAAMNNRQRVNNQQANGAIKVKFGMNASQFAKFDMINPKYWAKYGSRYPDQGYPEKLEAAKLAHLVEERLLKGEEMSDIARTMNTQLKSSREVQRHSTVLNLLLHVWKHGRDMVDAHNKIFNVRPGASEALSSNRFSF